MKSTNSKTKTTIHFHAHSANIVSSMIMITVMQQQEQRVDYIIKIVSLLYSTSSFSASDGQFS